MISRCLFVCLYLFSFFLINRWYDLYHYYFDQSTGSLFSHRSVPTDQLTIKQLQYILNLRGVSYVHANEKYDLVQMVEQTGSVGENEFNQPLEDLNKHQTTVFTSYKQLLDMVDDCKENIWFVHLLPTDRYRQTSTYLSLDQWHGIERRLAAFQIQTGVFNCSTADPSNICRTMSVERFILLVPSRQQRSMKMYNYDIRSTKHYDYQSILQWLSQTLERHVQKDPDRYDSAKENQSVLEFHINANQYSSFVPLYYFPLLYRYGSTIHFRLNIEEQQAFAIKFAFLNSSTNTYLYNERENSHESYSFRALNLFLSCLTINTHTLMSIYFLLLNIYFLYDIYLVQSFSWMKKIFMINLISAFLWSTCFIYVSTERIDSLLQMLAFHFIRLSQDSKMLMCLRNDFFVYSIMSKWILYPMITLIHVTIGLCFRWYLTERFGRTTDQIPNEAIMIDQTHAWCSKVWQFLLCLLFSEQQPHGHTDRSLLQYFSQDSLWLDPHSLIINSSSLPTSPRPKIDFSRLPVWRFTVRRRHTAHGAREYYSDIELEPSLRIDQQSNSVKKPCLHRRLTNLVSLASQENCYTSESDENNNSLTSTLDELNSSERYQCSICLEKYLNHVYLCTLPCFHHFHRKCLFDWFENSEHQTCPLCRSPVMD